MCAVGLIIMYVILLKSLYIEPINAPTLHVTSFISCTVYNNINEIHFVTCLVETNLFNG